MKTEHLRRFLRKLLFDVLAVGLAIELERIGALETRGACELHAIQDLGADEDLEVSVVGTSIPTIGNVTTVHDLTIDVAEIIIGYLFVLGQIVVEHITADLEITIVEVVVTGPTLAAELLTTENEGVEHAESEEEGLELRQLVGGSPLEVGLVEHVESTTDVGLEISGRLICDLD